MQLIATSLVLLALSICCSAVSIGYKTNFKEDSVLIIGEISKVASSVQISNIIHQLKIFKNLYTKLNNEILIPVTIGTRMKVSRTLVSSDACLYDVGADEFANFLRSKISVTVGANYGIQTYLTNYQRPLLLLRSSDSIPDRIELVLDDPILVDINEVFSESMEVTYHSRSVSPTLEYDEIYGTGHHINSGLLRQRTSGRAVKCLEKYCNIM